MVSCAVKKYSGDDPDISNGVLVYSQVRLSESGQIHIDGGIGVGRVTRPGLNQPVGEAAINRVPRQKIRKEEEEAKKKMVGVTYEGKKYTYDAKKIEEKLAKYDYSNDGKKMVFLTFDDGSSTTVTPEILKILKENDVRATFFVTGENIERGGKKAEDLIKESFEYGNAIANHSYTHNYKYLYPGRTLNLDNFLADFNKTDELLKKILGPYFSTRVIRCPGGHMSWK